VFHVVLHKARPFRAGLITPGTAYSLANCVTVTTQAQRELLGAWRVAKTVLKAYKHFQQ
jgi:hypothetical protein